MLTEEQYLAACDPAKKLTAVKDLQPEELLPRKLRLFACACVRRIQHLFGHPECHTAVIEAEYFADGVIDGETLRVSEQAARTASSASVRIANDIWSKGSDAPTARRAWIPVWAACAAENACNRETPEHELNFALRTAQLASWAHSVHQDLNRLAQAGPASGQSALFFAFLRGLTDTVKKMEQAVADGDGNCETVVQAALVDEIFGNPYRQIRFLPEWNTFEHGLILNMAAHIYVHRKWGDLPVLSDALEDAGCEQPHILDHLRSEALHTRGCWVLDGLLAGSAANICDMLVTQRKIRPEGGIVTV